MRDAHIPETFSRTKNIRHLAPLPYNPGSLNGALQGLRHVARLGGLRDFVPKDEVKREWLVFVLHVGALVEAKKCIDNSFWDGYCQISIWGEEDFLDHMLDHPEVDVSDPKTFLEFKNVILEPGFAHIEENFNSNWLSDDGRFRSNPVELCVPSKILL